MESNRCVRDVLELDIPSHQLVQSSIRDQLAPATQSGDERAHADRKDVLAPQAVPDTRELVRSRDRLRPGRHERSVQRTRRRSHQYIGGDPPLVDRPQHPAWRAPRLAPPER